MGHNAHFSYPCDITVDQQGIILVADSANCCIRMIDPATNMVSTLASQFNGPHGVAVDNDNHVIVAETYSHRIWRIERSVNNTINLNVIAGTGNPGFANGKGTGADFNHPYSVAVDHAGNIIVADKETHHVRSLTRVVLFGYFYAAR